MNEWRVEIVFEHIRAGSPQEAARIALARARSPGDHCAAVYGADEYAEAGDVPTIVDLRAEATLAA